MRRLGRRSRGECSLRWGTGSVVLAAWLVASAAAAAEEAPGVLHVPGHPEQALTHPPPADVQEPLSSRRMPRGPDVDLQWLEERSPIWWIRRTYATRRELTGEDVYKT